MMKEYREIVRKIDKTNMSMEEYLNAIENKAHYIVLDTETTGLYTSVDGNIPNVKQNLHAYDTARILQFSWGIYDVHGNLLKIEDYYIKPEGYKVSATHIHGITEEIASKGFMFSDIVKKFRNDFMKVKYIVGHNVQFDANVLMSEMIRRNMNSLMREFQSIKRFCTAEFGKTITNFYTRNGFHRFPKQMELYEEVVGEKMKDAHNSKYDVLNLGKIVSTLITQGRLTFE